MLCMSIICAVVCLMWFTIRNFSGLPTIYEPMLWSLIHVCYEYLFEKSRGIAGSSFLAFLKFSLIHILFPLWYKTEFPRQFYDISNLQTKNLLYLVLKNAIQMSLSATSGDSVMFKTIICLKICGLILVLCTVS